jgi:hypothetical protein
MVKFTIDTRDGLKRVEAIPFRFKSPGWLKQFRFITHATNNGMLEPGYTLTDIKTGRTIASGYDTRKEAKKAGRETLIVVGRAAFLEARSEGAIDHNIEVSHGGPH